jgi:GNAT superfamily N-acetyltransferase
MKINEISENISHTSKRLHDIEKEKGVKPGTPEWFKLWFSLPYLKESITEAFIGENKAVNEATEMKISDLTISDAGMAIAQSVGGGSRTDAPLAVTKLPSGHVYLVNGYHRLVDAMNSGKDTVSVEYVPYERVAILWKQEREQDIKYGKQFNEEVEVSLHGDAKKGYVLSKIEVSGDERNAGQGTKAMQDIVDRMDREGAVIALTPDDAFGGNKNRLIKFYKRFGFVPNKGRNKDFRFRETMIRYPQTNESINEGYKLQLERDTDMMVLNITDTTTGKRTEVRGKAGYETNGYDANDKLHKLLDKISKSANISELMNGEVVGINPKHPAGPSAKTATTTAFNESLNNPYPYEWDSRYDGSDSWLANASMDVGELMVMFTVGEPGESWTIDFAVDGSMDKTGDGDQFRIFATVVTVIKDWAANKVDLSKVTQIDFSSDKGQGDSEDSRAKLYKRFGKQLASKLGWNLEVTDRGQYASFKIKNPNAPVEEAVNEAEDTLTLPKISVGDEVMVGKFKNRKAEVKGFSKDDHNQPVLKTTKGDQKLFKPRLSKLMDK